MRARRILLCCSVVGALAAMEDLVVDDVRLGLGRSPQGYHIQGEGDAATTAVRGTLQYVHSFGELEPDGAWILGVEGAVTDARHRGDGDVSVANAIVDVLPGYAAPLPDELRPLHVEVGPVLGFGRSALRRGGHDVRAMAWEYGVRGAAFWTFAERWQLGLDLRYVQAQFTPSLDGDRRRVDDHGIVAQALIGWRF